MSKSKKLIIGNWKMNPTSLNEAKEITSKLSKFSKYSKLSKTKADVVICPPFVYLERISNLLKAKSLKLKAIFGAQDVFYESEGAYTGQISAPMLKNLGVQYVIVGHSEKRALGETNEIVAKKIGACLKNLLTPIVCIGESSRDESGNYFSFVRTQIEEIFSARGGSASGGIGIPKSALNKIVIAYEPIWAIGKKAIREATPAESEEMAIFIRKVFNDLYDQKSAQGIKILYGGSVNTKNAREFLKSGGVDGLLVGRDSLDAKKFIEIIKQASK